MQARIAMRGTLRRRAFYHWLVPPALGVEVDNASRVQRGFRIFLPCVLGARRLRTPLPVSFFFPSPFPPVLQGNKWLCVPLHALQPSTEIRPSVTSSFTVLRAGDTKSSDLQKDATFFL